MLPGMAIFHDAFVAFKARCPLTANINPDDFVLGGQKKLFQGYVHDKRYPQQDVVIRSLHHTSLADGRVHRRILDDGFEHNLTLYKDKSCGKLRLSATARDTNLKRTPVWTAFCTFLRAVLLSH